LSSLNESIELAINEEKLNLATNYKGSNQNKNYYNGNNNHNKIPYCNFCKTNTHYTRDCRQSVVRQNFNPNFNQRNNLNNSAIFNNAPRLTNSNFSPQVNTLTQEKICRYCKNPGHTLEECRKLAMQKTRIILITLKLIQMRKTTSRELQF